MKWRKVEARMTIARREDRVLGIMANKAAEDADWTVVAVETSSEAFAAGTSEAVFGDHAHDAVGTFSTFKDVEKAVVAYVRTWKAKSQVERCPCGPIKEAA